MPILSPEERAQAWHDAVSAPAGEREYKRHMLVSAAFQLLGPELGLYSDEYAVALRDSFDLLALSGLIGRDELREAFEQIDEQSGSARVFAAALGRHLRATATTKRLDDRARERAAELAQHWREIAAGPVAGTIDDDGGVYVTVAEVAAVYDVTPQAVYKWIHRGLIEAHSRPGGSYQIPIAALTSDERFDAGRARRLHHALARRHEAQDPVSTGELVEQMRTRRSRSQSNS